jgi:WD40 repeat protein
LDAITDLSFAPNGNMFVTAKYLGEKREYRGSSVLLITPTHEVKTLVFWDRDTPGARTVWSISVDPKTGVAVAYDQGTGELISIDEEGKVSLLPNSFDFDTAFVYLDHALDGTLYATETNRKDLETGPLVERNIIRFDENGSPIIIAGFNHIGCCTTENIAIAPDGTIYVLSYKLEGNDMSLWRITNDGEKILLSDKLPIDPLSVASDSEGNIYVACSAGLLRIWEQNNTS